MNTTLTAFRALVLAAFVLLGTTAAAGPVEDGFQALLNNLASLGVTDDEIMLVDINTIDLTKYCSVFGLFSDSNNGNCFLADDNATVMNDNFPEGGDFINAFGNPATALPWLPPQSINNLIGARFLDHNSAGIFAPLADALADPADVLPLGDDDDRPNVLVFIVTKATPVTVTAFPGMPVRQLVPGDLIIGLNDTDPSDLDYNDFIVVAEFCPFRIDIKPFDCANMIFPCTDLDVCVGIYGGPECDVKDIDVESITFGPGGAAPQGKIVCADINKDGFNDLIVCFDLAETGLTPGDTEGCMQFEFNGEMFEFCDKVSVKPVPPAFD